MKMSKKRYRLGFVISDRFFLGTTSSLKLTVIGKNDENVSEERIEYINGQAEYNAEQTSYMPVIQDLLDDCNAEIISEYAENYLRRFIEEYETSSYREEIREEDWKTNTADVLEEQ